MEKTEILMRIKDAETKVEEAMKKAEEQRKRAIFEAKIQAKKIIDDANAEANKLREEIIKRIKENLEKEKYEMKSKKLKDIENFERRGKENIDKAVEFLYNEFMRLVKHA